jgi:DNA-binding CsgD family transcriptional regulator/transcriptional regulator with XRE-family HTH domain
MRAAPLRLRDGDLERLSALTRASSAPAGLALRARIVLLAAEGVSHTEIAERVKVSRPTVIAWRSRYERSGLAGLQDRPRSGRPRVIDHRAVIAATLRPPPATLGVTHWSRRLLAERLGIDHATVARAWKAYGVAPWRCETFKFATDPELVAKVTAVVGLYLAPPQNAIVLCVDEKSQIQALDRTAPTLPMQSERAARWSHDYRRQCTTTLFAALDVATGKVTAACKPRHCHQELLDFCKRVARAYPDRELHLVMDNYAAHKRPEIRDWLTANPRVQVYFTPTSVLWMNLVEVWFGITERQAIRRGTYRGVRELNSKIRAFIDGWNERAHPFVWIKPAEDILVKAIDEPL